MDYKFWEIYDLYVEHFEPENILRYKPYNDDLELFEKDVKKAIETNTPIKEIQYKENAIY